jgi:hypothetical protein
MLKSLFLFFIFTIFSFANEAILPREYQSLLGLGLDVNWVIFNKEIKQKAYKNAIVLKNKGFDSIRIRFKYFNGTILRKDQYIKLLKNSVDETLKSGMIPILSFTGFKFCRDPNQNTLKEALDVWKEIAEIFKDYPYKLSYNLLLEPGKKLNKNSDILNQYYKKAIEEIRYIDSKRIIMIAPIHASNPYYLPKLDIPHDKYLMIEWHFYASGPSKTNKNKLWTDGNKKEIKLIQDKIDYAYSFCKKKGLYSWVGALMPGNYNKGNSYSNETQISFMKAILDNLNRYNIPIAINADHQFYDYEKKTFRIDRKDVLNFIVTYYKNQKNIK